MDFVNESPAVSRLFRGTLNDEMMFMSLLARVRYQLTEDGELVIATGADALDDVRRQAVDLGEYGKLEADTEYPRVATDLIVLGDAVARENATEAMRVHVTAGSYDVALNVFGDRVWEKPFGGGNLVPSPPKPFVRMPVTYRRAFGGNARTDYGDLPYHKNPEGVGYYFKPEDALGQPLPNIEASSLPVKEWSDYPEPGGLCPYPTAWGMRLLTICSYDPKTGLKIYPDRGMFDRAHPWLSGKPLIAGQRVKITGMSTTGAVEFSLPECPVELELRLGGSTHVRTLELEECLVDLRTRHVELSFRKMMKYLFVKHEMRTATLRRRILV